jgi:hypothetical protein
MGKMNFNKIGFLTIFLEMFYIAHWLSHIQNKLANLLGFYQLLDHLKYIH